MSSGKSGVPASGTRSRTGRVLILDDDPRSAAAIVGVLADHLEVTVLGNAAAGIDSIVAGARYDVVLCDLTMSGMTGPEIFARVCAASRRQAARIVFISSSTVPLGVADFLARVASPCMQRPLNLEALRSLVDRRVAEELARIPPQSARSG
jgi:CheY-like chemotaxis protein